MLAREYNDANKIFPIKRLAKLIIILQDDRVFGVDQVTSRWNATNLPSAGKLKSKYHIIEKPLLGKKRAQSISDAVNGLNEGGALTVLELLVGGVR